MWQLLIILLDHQHCRILLKLLTRIMKFTVLCLLKASIRVFSYLLSVSLSWWGKVQGLHEIHSSQSRLLRTIKWDQDRQLIEVWIENDLLILHKYSKILSYLIMSNLDMNKKIEKASENQRNIRRRERLQELQSLLLEIISCRVRLKVLNNHCEISSQNRNLCFIKSKNEFREGTKSLRLLIHMMNLTYKGKLREENEKKLKEFIDSQKKNDCKENGNDETQNWD